MNRLPHDARFSRPHWAISTLSAIWILISLGADSTALAQNHSPEPASPKTDFQGASEPSTKPEIYGQGVRETEWQTPQQELAGFHLPPGFKIELFAAEPQIAKPLNMAWDWRGRLWITNTVEYPYPAERDAIPRDSIKILEDTDGDGRADKVTTFADQLNIPMGLLPVRDGVICFSIPYIWHLRDIDGDDHVDERIPILGPFDTSRDTHGMINALRQGADGWIYACHGFNNQSEVTAQDGSRVQLLSGNTFRFRPDGSSIEPYSFGQVNPFGMTQDEYGNWYTADCHSKPITGLIRGGCYPSFGRPHDGLGFAPSMMDHLHDSTAIAGLVYYLDNAFPEAYRHLFFSGNVMTSRINCNRLVWQGATPIAEELPDFLTSEDPWFRPVDLQVGPKGDLFVADFYNKIIGHYEVPLTHPDRDRDSGRIWRISYDETKSSATDGRLGNLLRADIERQIYSEDSNDAALIDALTLADAEQFRASIKILSRRNSLNAETISTIVAGFHQRAERGELGSNPWLSAWTHTCLMAQSWPEAWQAQLLPIARRMARNHESSPLAARAAIELLGSAGSTDDIQALLASLPQLHSDSVLQQVTRIAIRNLMRQDLALKNVLANYAPHPGQQGDLAQPGHPLPQDLAEILPGIPSTLAALTLLRHLVSTSSAQPELTSSAVKLLMDNLPQDGPILDDAVQLVEQVCRGNAELYAQRLGYLSEQYQATYSIPSETLRRRIMELLADGLLPELHKRFSSAAPHSWLDEKGQAWLPQQRIGQQNQPTMLWSSHTLGEAYTGVLSSEPFACPDEIRFWLAGHNGLPSDKDSQKSYARLVLHRTGRELLRTYPPRSDTASEVSWNTRTWAGEKVRLELVDRNRASAYAWLAAGDFSPALLQRNDYDALLRATSTLLQSTDVGSELPEFEAVLAALPAESRIRSALLAAYAAGTGSSLAKELIEFTMRLQCTGLVENQIVFGPQGTESDSVQKLAEQLCSRASMEQQAELAGRLLSSTQGCVLMVRLLESGTLSPRALAGKNTDTLPNALPAEAKSQLSEVIQRESLQAKAHINLAEVLSQLDWSQADTEKGKLLFEQHCANCHQLRGSGKLIGPQLDGAVARNHERLLEDILLPNQNVDPAFRQTNYLLENETIIAGLAKTQPDGSILVTFQDGNTRSLRPRQIVEQKQLDTSLMPANFREVLDNQQLASLLTYLTSISQASQD
ncbi:MAG: c-type cytochrome [bacterium]|nr:c-type cytochrome [bacterium]